MDIKVRSDQAAVLEKVSGVHGVQRTRHFFPLRHVRTSKQGAYSLLYRVISPFPIFIYQQLPNTSMGHVESNYSRALSLSLLLLAQFNRLL